MAGWIFRRREDDCPRRGGLTGEKTFPLEVGSLVREVIQNSMDAVCDETSPVSVHFRFIDLDGASLEAFKTAMGWAGPAGIEDNLEAASTTTSGGDTVLSALTSLRQGSFRLLVIEEENTVGVEGTELRPDGHGEQPQNNFCGLVRDELLSDKSDENSGGSHGVGKIMLWAMSDFRTVLFASQLRNLPDDDRGHFGASGISNPRFIGRTWLPSHHTDDDLECQGDGFFGASYQKPPPSTYKMAVSLWGPEAETAARGVHASRDGLQSGTSIVVVAFSEPDFEGEREPEELASAVRDSTLESFWPAIAENRLKVRVSHSLNDTETFDRAISLTDGEGEWAQLAALLSAYRDDELGDDALLRPGDRCCVDVPISVPLRTHSNDPHPAFKGHATLLIEMLDENAPKRLKYLVCPFRGPRMVLCKEVQKGLSLMEHPYCAVLLCGQARGPSIEDKRVDRVLRASEPAAHNLWHHRERTLKARYAIHGWGAALERFKGAWVDAIRQRVSITDSSAEKAPRSISKHLKFGGENTGEKRFISLVGVKGSVGRNDEWRFQGKITRPNPDATQKGWRVDLEVVFPQDGPGGKARVPIAGDSVKLKTEDGAAELTGVDPVVMDWNPSVGDQGLGRIAKRDRGKLIIELPSNVNGFRFEGATDPREHPAGAIRSAIELRASGKAIVAPVAPAGGEQGDVGEEVPANDGERTSTEQAGVPDAQ